MTLLQKTIALLGLVITRANGNFTTKKTPPTMITGMEPIISCTDSANITTLPDCVTTSAGCNKSDFAVESKNGSTRIKYNHFNSQCSIWLPTANKKDFIFFQIANNTDDLKKATVDHVLSVDNSTCNEKKMNHHFLWHKDTNRNDNPVLLGYCAQLN